MADEITAQASLIIQSTDPKLEYQSRPTTFKASLTGFKGPTPGAITVTTAGTDVDLSQLTTPGFCRLSSLEASGGNYYEWGIWDPQTLVFYPLGEVGPGETYVIKFSRNLQEEYSAPGTGTATTGPTNRFRLKANGASVTALVECFER